VSARAGTGCTDHLPVFLPGIGAEPGILCGEGGKFVSIIRVGLAETKKFAEGYDAIFGKKKKSGTKKATASAKAGSAKKARKSKKK